MKLFHNPRRWFLVYTLAAMWLVSPVVSTAAESADTLHQLQNAFTAVAEEASKSVVVIQVTTKVSPEERGTEDFELPFDWWFGPDQQRRPSRPSRPQPQQSQGSGFIIRSDGFILTNNHVVEGANKIEVKLKDGRTFPAKIQGADKPTDVAVIKIEADKLPTAKLGNSDKVRVGQWAIAIGAPFHLDYSITVGVVSGKGRAPHAGTPTAYEDFLQTDASINPGNSGGPLVDVDGNVIGINTAIRGLNTGIGFAIPINLVKNISEKLIASGKVVRPWLGIEAAVLQDNDEMRELIRVPAEGVVVRSVNPDTPADRSGLKPMDVITSVDGTKVTNIKQLQQEIQKRKIGDNVTLEVWHDAKKREVKLVLAEMRESDIARAAIPPAEKLGLKAEEFTKENADKFGMPGLQGVRVVAVNPSGPASRIRISPGDIITEIDRQPIRSLGDFNAAVQKADLKRGVAIQFTTADTHARSFGIIPKTED